MLSVYSTTELHPRPLNLNFDLRTKLNNNNKKVCDLGTVVVPVIPDLYTEAGGSRVQSQLEYTVRTQLKNKKKVI
jgi:hypothetical protein